MFYDTRMEIVNSADFTTLKEVDADVQAYHKSITFEDGYTLEMTHRVFCPKDSSLQLYRYVRINEYMFIILDLKEWSDYLELFLYRCKQDFA